MMVSVIYEFDLKSFNVYAICTHNNNNNNKISLHTKQFRCPLMLCSHPKRVILGQKRIFSMFHNFLTGYMTTHDLSVMPGCFCIGEMNR